MDMRTLQVLDLEGDMRAYYLCRADIGLDFVRSRLLDGPLRGNGSILYWTDQGVPRANIRGWVRSTDKAMKWLEQGNMELSTVRKGSKDLYWKISVLGPNHVYGEDTTSLVWYHVESYDLVYAIETAFLHQHFGNIVRPA